MNNMRLYSIIAGAIMLVLCGCQNPWNQFYQGEDLPAGLPTAGEPQLVPVRIDSIESLVKEYLRNDYVLFGQSAFNSGGNVSLGELSSLGKKLNADVIVYAVGNQTRTQTSMAVPQYHPGGSQTTYVSGYGSGGYFQGTAHSYGSGTYSTTIVPVTIVRQDYIAVFLKRNWHRRLLGIQFSPLSPQEARVAGDNSGIKVDLVVRGTPAFESNIFEGDIILEINGTRPQLFLDNNLESHSGKEVRVVLLRNGARQLKIVRLR